VLRAGLADLGDFFEFTLPTHAGGWSAAGFSWDSSGARCDPSWFGFMLRVRATAPFNQTQLACYLESKKIGNRALFGGNLLRQPAFVQLRKDRPSAFRVVGEMTGADELMQRSLFLGTYPGLTPAMLDYEMKVIHEFARAH
jgi:CDP-6-deoxy-D-xylo-4-hexulose-3-dehydrase